MKDDVPVFPPISNLKSNNIGRSVKATHWNVVMSKEVPIQLYVG